MVVIEYVNIQINWHKYTNFRKNMLFLCFEYCPDGEMVDALVSGASAARHVGSSPILGTHQAIGDSMSCIADL